MRAKEICVIYMISRKTCASAVLAFRPYISKGNQPAELFCFIALLLPATHRFQSFRYLRSVNTPSPCKTVKLARYSESTTVVVAEPVNEEADSESKTCGKILVFLSWVLVCLTMPFSLFICFKVVQEYERAVIFRLGRLLSGGAKGPGIFFILPCIDTYARVDLRTRTYDIPPQEVLTKDSVTVSVDAVVYYRVHNATISIANVENAHHSTRLLAQTTLRNTMGTRPLHEILSERETISGSMQLSLDEATEAWGIKVERVEIKDVRLPVQLQRAMAAEAEAAREARAKTLNTISAEKNSTIVFPLPIDLITYFLRAKEDSQSNL
ncbi:hypothetical protein HF086_018380 [Spodoptera exigua]|uniref:Band 7 domain-containing protein n=1 Tax=Spodoptera exigua TaxID=7107 RepID=A0A922MWJ3_SPOEX|nr:hypothetical protein HF086_018380 [Spodoptera exigua]